MKNASTYVQSIEQKSLLKQLSTFRVQIQNLLKKWVWIQVELSQTGKVTQLPPDTHHQFIHIGSYGEIFKFPILDLESPQNLSLDAS